MSYHVIDSDGIDPKPNRPSEKRSLSDAAGFDAVGVHVFTAAPGEQIPTAYHYHDEQEELLYVLDGSLAVETPEETYHVDVGEAFAAEPDSPHRAYNPEDAEQRVRVLAIGAPAVDDVHPYEG